MHLDDTYLSGVFDKHKTTITQGLRQGAHGISKDNIPLALKELEYVDEEYEFLSDNTNHDGFVDFEEFKSRVRRPSPVEQWCAPMPLYKIVAAALAAISSRRDPSGKDTLQSLSACSDSEVVAALDHAMRAAAHLILEKIKKLKMKDSRVNGATSIGECKYVTVPEMNCGSVKSFFDGLGERVGITS